MECKIVLANPNARVPTRSTLGSVGYDMYSAERLTVPANQRALVDTGVQLEFPFESESGGGIYARIAPRSGLALKGIDVSAGVCDSDYRGTYKVLLVNTSNINFDVNVGDRIAQLIFERTAIPSFKVVFNTETEDALSPTGRGAGGFGST